MPSTHMAHQCCTSDLTEGLPPPRARTAALTESIPMMAAVLRDRLPFLCCSIYNFVSAGVLGRLYGSGIFCVEFDVSHLLDKGDAVIEMATGKKKINEAQVINNIADARKVL